MTDKNIKIRAVLDTQGFDQEINKLQQKLRTMQRTGEGLSAAQGSLGGDTLLGSYAKQAFGDFSKESKQQLESMFQSQRREALNQSIQMRSKQQELDKLAKVEGDMTRQQQQRVDLLQKELDLLRVRNRETIAAAGQTGKALGDLGDGAGGAGGAGVPSVPSPGDMFKKLLQGVSIAAIVNGVLNATEHALTRDRKMLAATATGAGIASQGIRESIAGQGFRGNFWAAERQQAMDMAIREKQGRGLQDFLQIGGRVAGAAGAGFAFGGPAGAAAGAIGGFGSAMGNDRLMSRVFDQEHYQKLLTKEGMQQYQGNLAALKALDPMKDIAAKAFERDAGKMQILQRELGMTTDAQLLGGAVNNPILNQLDAISNAPMVGNIMTERFPNYRVRTGRGFRPTGRGPLAPGFGGLQGDNVMDSLMTDMFGGNEMMTEGGVPMGRRSEGFLIDQMMGEMGTGQFTKENILRQRSALMAGGGGTDMQNLASRAARMERNLNLTNAGQLMGTIGGAGMGVQSGQSEDAVKRLLAEGVKMGIDVSTMPQEMKRFTAAAAQVMTKGGGMSETALARFAEGAIGTTTTEIDASKSAYEQSLARAKAGGGFEAQVGYGVLTGDTAKELLGEEAASKLGSNTGMLNSLNQLSLEDLERTPGLLEGYAKRLGTTPEKVRQLIAKKDAKKQTKLTGLETLLDKFNEKTAGMSTDELNQFFATEEGATLESKITDRMGMEREGFLQKGAAQRRADVVSAAAVQRGDIVGGDSQIPELLRRPKGGRLGDALGKVEAGLATEPDTAFISQEKSQATGQITELKALRDNIDGLKAAAKNHSEAAEQYNIEFAAFIEAAKQGKDALEKMKDEMDKVTSRLAIRDYVTIPD